jgi:hypothetical protein
MRGSRKTLQVLESTAICTITAATTLALIWWLVGLVEGSAEWFVAIALLIAAFMVPYAVARHVLRLEVGSSIAHGASSVLLIAAMVFILMNIALSQQYG